MECKHTAVVSKDFDDYILEVTCSNHGRVIDTVIPERELSNFLFVGSIGAPVALFNIVVKAFNEVGAPEAARYLPN